MAPQAVLSVKATSPKYLEQAAAALKISSEHQLQNSLTSPAHECRRGQHTSGASQINSTRWTKYLTRVLRKGNLTGPKKCILERSFIYVKCLCCIPKL